jgi:alkylation response protein AidB-like acyl-CoA dehydrogenase
VDFSLGPEVEEYRRDVRQIIAETVTPAERHRQHSTGSFVCTPLYRALAERGYIERAVPGIGKGDPIELWVLFNEMEKAAAPSDALSVLIIVAGIINRVGTSVQRERILPSLLAGESLACLGYSEPGCGSDLAAVSTRARRDGAEWVINGAKMWTTMAHIADWVLLLTRTDPTVSKHKGLTMFVLPMDTPGISISPVPTMATERTNATFYDDVRVGDDCLLGGENRGWDVLTVGLSFERGVVGDTNGGVSLLRHFRGWAEQTGRIADPLVREKMARTAIDNEVAKLLTQRSAWIAASGDLPGVEGSMTKLFAIPAYQKAVQWFQEITGPEGLLQFDEPGAAAGGWIEYEGRHSPASTIRGGTTEINRTNVGQRHLGLPRAT